MNSNIFHIVFLLFFFLRPPALSAQEPLMVFDDMGLDSEIAYDQIEHILVDKDGFIWLGTSTGLHKFDGYDYQTFSYNANDSNSISENFASISFEDSKGSIWIGTYNYGINVYDKTSQKFSNYRNVKDSSFSPSNTKVLRRRNAIVEDREGFIWASTENGLNRIDPETKTVKKYLSEANGHLLYDSATHSIWIGDKTLISFDIKPGKATKVVDSELIKQINALAKVDETHLWLGTLQGLFIYASRTNKLFSVEDFYEASETKIPKTWTTQPIAALYQDFRQRIWIATGKSVFIFDPSTQLIEELKYSPSNNNGILDQKIRGIYGDKKGTVFITYENRGITRLNAKTNHFKKVLPRGGENLIQNNIRSIFKDDKGRLWIGTYTQGLISIDQKNNQFLGQFTFSPTDPASINSNFITAIFVDSANRLWVGSFEDGFCFADLDKDRLPSSFRRSSFDQKVEIHAFTEDAFGRVWISTNIGFYIYDKKTETYSHYGNKQNEVKAIQNVNIQAAVYEQPNIFWLATWNNGVAKLTINPDSLFNQKTSKDEALFFDQNQDKNGATIDNRFITLTRSRSGTLWLGSNVNGLVKLSSQGGEIQFEKFDKSSGAPSNSIFGIEEDQEGNLWVSSSNGLGKFDPISRSFSNFYENDGLVNDVFIWDSHFQGEDGELFFGGIKGVNSFHPKNITSEKATPIPYFKDLIINHKPVGIGEQIHDRVILDKSIRFAKEITLTSSEPIFSIEFAALHSKNPDEVQFEYALDGFDENWIQTSSENRIATYTNLPKGTYTFKVRESRNMGEWQNPATLQIHILPPWWNTSWAYAAYFIISFLLLYFFKRELSNRLKLRHSLALEQYKHERDNELNQEKFKFFTNLSHELRTPLTLILGPLDRMIKKNETGGRTHQNLLLIQTQAQKLQALTNQLLTFRKYDPKNIKLKAAEGNITKFLSEIATAFKQHAKIKEIDFQFLPHAENINLFWDRDKLEVVIVNILSNAFKFTPKNGRIVLKCHEIDKREFQSELAKFSGRGSAVYGELPKEEAELVEISICDTGCGIKKEQLQHIFDRYFQATNAKLQAGSGIGLAISKNFVEIHSGCICVHSMEGKGAEFLIWLPKGKQHLKAEEIIKDFKPSEHKDHYENLQIEAINPTSEQEEKEVIEAREKKNLPTLLIIDDNPDIVFFLKESFQNQYNVFTAKNGKEGLGQALELIPDLIISDIMMPVMDGLELCKSLKTDIRTSHIPVVLLTARTSTVFQAEGLEIGADDYISKPFDERILTIRVKNLIDSRKALRERYQKEPFFTPKDIAITQPDEIFLEKLLEYVDSNISDNKMKIENVAKEMGLSHSVLYKKVLALTGQSVVEFIRTIRLKKASLILTNTKMGVSQVGYEVGFSDPKYFSKCFQKHFGSTPTQYRTSNSGNKGNN